MEESRGKAALLESIGQAQTSSKVLTWPIGNAITASGIRVTRTRALGRDDICRREREFVWHLLNAACDSASGIVMSWFARFGCAP